MTKKIFALLAATALTSVRSFDNSKRAGWKLDADGKIEMKDGNPVWVDEDGSEKTMGGDTIRNLNNEAKTHRVAKETAEASLKAFMVDGKLIDPAIAIKAVETVGKLNAKQLIDAGEVDKVREQISGQFTTQLAEKDKAIAALQGDYDGLRVGNVFSNSEFVKERVAVPRDFFEAAFRGNFKLEGGKIVAYDKAGNRMMSKKTMGEFAEPDEALELLVEQHPQKDMIIKAQSNSGSGNGGGGGNRGGGRYMKRSEFDGLDAGKAAAAAAEMRAGTLQIVD